MTPGSGQVLGWHRLVRLEEGLCRSERGIQGRLESGNFAVVTCDVNIRGS